MQVFDDFDNEFKRMEKDMRTMRKTMFDRLRRFEGMLF